MEIRNQQKHAYLIIAHNKFDQLAILIDLLDDPRNDIYLHIDKKVSDFDPDTIKTQHAKLHLVDPVSVTWGGHSQIACEMQLFRCAGAGHYMYYHLLSGIDLPLKTQDEIHAFCQSHAGSNFISFDEKAMVNGEFRDRTQYYHLLRDVIGKRRDPVAQGMKVLEKISIALQKCFRLKRKEWIPLYKGANWVSITDEMVQYLLTCEELIKKQFYYSFCADEVFLQSLAMQSPCRDSIVNNYYRKIDWSTGEPLIYSKEDVPALLASDALFARKFDLATQPQAVAMVVEHLKGKPSPAE